MDLTNRFKAALSSGRVQVGCWVSLADPLAAEITAGARFDWLLIDAEHAPNDLRTVLGQLQAVAAYPCSAVVRPPTGDPVLIKQLLDLGAQTLLVPMVDDAGHAAQLARAVRYPPGGIRGVATTRASRWGRTAGYWSRADEEVCLVVQLETPAALSRVEDLAAVEGVDALFVGPSDLAAAMGHLGDPAHPDVRAAVFGAIERIRAAGKPAGVFAVDPELATASVAAGASFVAAGTDTALLAGATSALAERFGTQLGSA